VISADDFDRQLGADLVDDLRACDVFLDRLGRRELDAGDLDDPLAASLALLAGDVDLRPVPVEATRRALREAGLWPLPGVGRGVPDRGKDVPDRGKVDAATIICPRTPLEGRGASSVADVPRCVDRRRRERRTRLPPRALRMWSSVGLIVAAILVLLGGGISTLMMGGKTADPIDQFTLVVQRSEDAASLTPYAELAAKLAAAQVMLRQGHPTQATSIVGEVRSHLEEIAPAQRQDLLARITQIEGAIRAATNDPTASVEN
jgi:hypothetical protein